MGLRYSKTTDLHFNFENKLDVEMIFKFNAYANQLIEQDDVKGMVNALTKGFNYWNPTYRKLHPCYHVLNNIAKVLVEKHNYRVKVHDPKHGYGVQICVYLPDDNYNSFYHSNYDYERAVGGPIDKAKKWLGTLSIGGAFQKITDMIINHVNRR